MTIADIKRHVASHLGVENAWSNDCPAAQRARRITVHLARKITCASYREIAKAMGYARHCTAVYHDHNVRNALRKDSALRGIIAEIERDIRALTKSDYAAILSVAESGSTQRIPLTREQLESVRSLIASFAEKREAA